jgi:hypothetical protein
MIKKAACINASRLFSSSPLHGRFLISLHSIRNDSIVGFGEVEGAGFASAFNLYYFLKNPLSFRTQ